MGTPIFNYFDAVVVKLVYTLASGASDRKVVEVQVLSTAPKMLRKKWPPSDRNDLMEKEQRS
jgi:hypothetical protein